VLGNEDGLLVSLNVSEEFSGLALKGSDEFGTHGVILKYHYGLRKRVVERANVVLTCKLVSQRWALALKERTNHNKATCALASKLARIAWATWRHGTVFDPNQAASVA
jgi:hypothetical protein